jgi:hypothetical protein
MMKKIALALVIAAIAASPAAASLTKKKKVKKRAAESAMVAPAPTAAQTTNQNSLNFAKDSLPIFLPSWSMPLYMGVSGRKD